MNKFENLLAMLHDVNGYDGSLEHLEFFEMDMFDEIMENFEPMDIALKTFYGEFNPNDDYFRFNGYANLESLSHFDLEQELLEYENEIIDEHTRIEEEEGGF